MLIYYDHVDSTNRIAKEIATEGENTDAVVQAGEQSAGKGQYGRTFTSPAGGLYFSLLLQPELEPEHLPLITLATGLACRDIIHSTFDLNSKIKWPNDIYLKGKKLAGILCESVQSGSPKDLKTSVVIGVGLNVNNRVDTFPMEIQPFVTTLFEHLAIEVDLAALLSQLTTAIKKNVAILKKGRQELLVEWQQHDYLLNKKLVYTSGATTLQGIGRGISPYGYYRIRDTNGNEHAIMGGRVRPQP
jgi:BirA family biotin operon repressor/biotin-[acetyl-CoA-carboxylase] ligase